MCLSRGWSVKLPRSKLTKTMQLTLFLKALIFVIQICYKSRLITKQILRKQRAKTSNIKMKINLYVPTIQASIFQVWLAIILEKFVTTTTTTLMWETLEESVRDFPYKGKDRKNAPAIPMAKKMKPGGVKDKTTRFPGKFAQVGTFVTLSTLVSTTFLVSMQGFHLVQNGPNS